MKLVDNIRNEVQNIAKEFKLKRDKINNFTKKNRNKNATKETQSPSHRNRLAHLNPHELLWLQETDDSAHRRVREVRDTLDEIL